MVSQVIKQYCNNMGISLLLVPCCFQKTSCEN